MTDIRGLGALSIDATDPPVIAQFWADLLAGAKTIDADGDATVRATGFPRLDFLRVPETKEVKNRLHLDLAVKDLAVATEHAVSLGATRADDIYNAGSWQVLRDPEGNEFCLLPPGVS